MAQPPRGGRSCRPWSSLADGASISAYDTRMAVRPLRKKSLLYVIRRRIGSLDKPHGSGGVLDRTCNLHRVTHIQAVVAVG